MSGDTGIVYVDTQKPCPLRVARVWVLARDNRTCQLCAAPATDIDHIWPRYWGGTDHHTNLQALCGTCNKRKGNSVSWLDATPEQLLWAQTAVLERLAKLTEHVETIVDYSGLHDQEAFDSTLDFPEIFEAAAARIERMIQRVKIGRAEAEYEMRVDS